MDLSWQLLDWEYVCDQAPDIQIAFYDADLSAEYGVNFQEFIDTTEGLEAGAQKWWNSLDIDRKKELLAERRTWAMDIANSIDDLVVK